MLDRITAMGVAILKITLHVGIGTFLPVRTDDPRHHILRPERFEMTRETADRLNMARSNGRRIIAVGTTTTPFLQLWRLHADFLIFVFYILRVGLS
jgi:S-adenosylmethionine:tRNA ribosyltransferase-isomerase